MLLLSFGKDVVVVSADGVFYEGECSRDFGSKRLKVEERLKFAVNGWEAGLKCSFGFRIEVKRKPSSSLRSKRDSSAAQADAFTGSEREEKASAYFGRNDKL